MKNFALQTVLQASQEFWTASGFAEQDQWTSYSQICRSHPQSFQRTDRPGHFTGSAMVVSLDGQKVLLTHHRKLQKWLQLGGHADGNADLFDVAKREVQEESGLLDIELAQISLMDSCPILAFDCDIHEIPAHGSESSHQHYDLRFLFLADPETPLVISDESMDLRWFSLEEATELTDETSMRRQFAKIAFLRKREIFR